MSITSSRSLLKLMSIELVMPSSHLILCRPLLLLPSVFPSIRVFSNEGAQGPLILSHHPELIYSQTDTQHTLWYLPRCPVDKTAHFHCRRRKFDLWLGN